MATHLGSALCGAGCDVVQVYSRTKESAMELADKLRPNILFLLMVFGVMPICIL